MHHKNNHFYGQSPPPGSGISYNHKPEQYFFMSYSILIVEDDPVTSKLIERLLISLNYRVAGICTSGEETMNIMKQSTCDLVLMDIGLAGEMDGIKTADLIIEKYNIPVIYATGASDADTIQRAIESSTFGYILKPVGKAQLYTMVELTMQRFTLETKLKEREKELKILNENLEEKVAERTLRLEENNKKLEGEIERRKAVETDLKESLAKEKELNELKSRIVTIISHELKTPLTSILSSTELINFHADNRSASDKIIKHTGKIQKAVKNLTEMVNDTLFMSRAEADKVELQLKPINLRKFIDELVETQKSGEERSREFDIEYSDDVPEKLMLDFSLTKNILNNLISNALKYSDPESVVTLKFNYDKQQLLITVKDNGMGIPQQDLKHLFKMFHRASNVENIEGSGVGLAIVKRCVNYLNGKIDIDSKEGKGTTFYLRFKAKEA